MRTEITVLAKAMQILARDIHSADGVASSAIQEAADRLIEQNEKILKTESECDALQARIDGGVRAYAGRGLFIGIWASTENTVRGQNATIILDEGVHL